MLLLLLLVVVVVVVVVVIVVLCVIISISIIKKDVPSAQEKENAGTGARLECEPDWK